MRRYQLNPALVVLENEHPNADQWKVVDLSKRKPRLVSLEPWSEVFVMCLEKSYSKSELRKRFASLTGIAVTTKEIDSIIRALRKSGVIETLETRRS